MTEDAAMLCEMDTYGAVAKGIGDYGAMAMMSAFYLVLTAGILAGVFKWARSAADKIMENWSKHLEVISEREQANLELTQDIAEGLRTETLLRVQNLAGFAFDLAVEQVCRLTKNVRTENHISDKEKTAKKVRRRLQNIHDDRLIRFEHFSYHGKPLSAYCSQEWVEQVAQVVEGELYNPVGADNKRAYTNIKMAYDGISNEFHNSLAHV